MQKRILILVLSVMGSWMMMAQEHSFGVQVGFTEPIFRLNTPTEMGETRSHLGNTTLNGLKVGLVYDATIIKGFGFTIGLNYTYGMHYSPWGDYQYDAMGNKTAYPIYEYRTRYQYHQGELFVDWQYKFEIAKQTYILLYTGPTIQCALSMQATDFYREKNIPQEMIKTIASFESRLDEEYLRRLNVTWGVGAGFQYKRIFLRGGYDFGIKNPYKKSNFGEYGYMNPEVPAELDSRLTRGRIDQWQVKIGFYFWQSDN